MTLDEGMKIMKCSCQFLHKTTYLSFTVGDTIRYVRSEADMGLIYYTRNQKIKVEKVKRKCA